jgi:hypothetical protein
MSVRSALLLRGMLSMPKLGAFPDMGQVFQANDAVWVPVHNAPADLVVGRLFQPSFPFANDDKLSGR